MKKIVSFVIFVLCLLLSTAVYAGGWGHGGGGHYGGHGGYGHGGGYYGGHGYNGWAVGINFGGYPYYGYGAPYWGYGYVPAYYAPAYYAPAPGYYAPAPVYYVPSGHWEVQQTWIQGRQRYWVDQYYDKSRDVWVLGHWEERPGGPGYWSQQQVWVVQ
jgi:hypothetical protein